MKNSIVVVGLGYVGLPVATAAAKSGSFVVGIDLNQEKIFKINNGQSPIEDVKNSEISEVVELGRLKASSDFSLVKQADVILICVPTPLKSNHTPDLEPLESAVKSISENLREGALIILESTVAPGTTRNFLVPLIEKYSAVDIASVDVVFSPERIDPLNKTWNLKNTPKIVAGLTPKSTKRAVNFYSKFVDKIIESENVEVAETAKLLENSFRLINISFINELSKFCQRLGIEVNDVINAAATKPYGFMPFYPSVGVGGHCIPVDSLYLAHAGRSIGIQLSFIDLANKVNQEMPYYFIGRAEEKLKGLENKRILVVGVSYKPNISDVRESPIEFLLVGLKKKGADVYWHDDLVKEWNGVKSTPLSNNYDLAILATPHDYLDLTKLGNVPVLNTRNSIM